MAFHILGVERNAGHWTNLNTLRYVMVAHAFGALGRVDFINRRPHVNGCIGAFGLTSTTIDAFVCNLDGHRSCSYAYFCLANVKTKNQSVTIRNEHNPKSH